jgi:hypothetical protein
VATGAGAGGAIATFDNRENVACTDSTNDLNSLAGIALLATKALTTSAVNSVIFASLKGSSICPGGQGNAPKRCVCGTIDCISAL